MTHWRVVHLVATRSVPIPIWILVTQVCVWLWTHMSICVEECTMCHLILCDASDGPYVFQDVIRFSHIDHTQQKIMIRLESACVLCDQSRWMASTSECGKAHTRATVHL